ncbi:YhcN/YlaJ family sporulation lipoprotein [Paenibacillus sp. 2RAB27]|uniref:YhcN/YlaJ family sporulation lipoprotein n=1 Tax=Paenibacillus sp. 2RAB27 TaxID=3232991 RepID=UPI003F9DDEAB
MRIQTSNAITNIGQTGITPQLVKQIADQVRETDPNIQTVYVSTNPEFDQPVNMEQELITLRRMISDFFAAGMPYRRYNTHSYTLHIRFSYLEIFFQ